MEHRVTAVLVAAGSSTRMGFDKLSFDLGGETVLERSVRAFDECPEVDELVIVTGASSENAQRAVARCKKPVRLVKGGSTRAESARSGVAAAHGRLVAVHDAARPFVSQSIIADTIAAAARCGAAAPAVPVKDTIKQAKGGNGKTVPEGCMVENTPDRSTLYAVSYTHLAAPGGDEPHLRRVGRHGRVPADGGHQWGAGFCSAGHQAPQQGVLYAGGLCGHRPELDHHQYHLSLIHIYIDKTFIQSKMLNKSKGPAVHSLRAQADKVNYSMDCLLYTSRCV